jgi:ornithine cyclodeaminase/alanine dehydrogenase-like protein (mu-crystallin family)
VGAFQPEAREVDDVTVTRAHIVVDTYDGALQEAGDLLIPTQSKVIDRRILLICTKLPPVKKQRVQAESITLFKSVGCALEDLVTAQRVYRNGRADSQLATRDK